MASFEAFPSSVEAASSISPPKVHVWFGGQCLGCDTLDASGEPGCTEPSLILPLMQQVLAILQARNEAAMIRAQIDKDQAEAAEKAFNKNNPGNSNNSSNNSRQR